MSESVLRILLQLFAFAARLDGVEQEEKDVVRKFLEDNLNGADVPGWMDLFEKFLVEKESETVKSFCNKISGELSRKQLYIILLYLLEVIHADNIVSDTEKDFLSEVSAAFGLPDEEIRNMHDMVAVTGDFPQNDAFLVISSAASGPDGPGKHLQAAITGKIGILNIEQGKLYLVKYLGDEYLQLNHHFLKPGIARVLPNGSVLSLPHGHGLYFSDITRSFLQIGESGRISMSVHGLEYVFPKGNKGLRGVDLEEESGNLVAIMGASGSGKSTMLNILNGNYSPSAGEVLINGKDLHKNLDELKGLIGYVPQDDLLIEELTVYQNLFYNAKLCHPVMTTAELDDLVIKVLEDLGLSETRDLKVGNAMSKTISGGQRKRLNIGLELLRAPDIIFFDEPTSGLSSRDSENILDLLKELTFKGKLIFVVIHQPSSDIFKMFDRLLILDTGGFPVYYGNPVEAVMYFKKMSEQLRYEEAACPECGNINPEQIFNIIEARVVDEFGNSTNQRKFSPEKWNELFREHFGKPQAVPTAEKSTSRLKTPSWIRQFNVFVRRDFQSKLGNRQYLLINLIQAPLLALILSLLVRHSTADNGEYMFGRNDNIPAFFFMSIVVALFTGMTMSAEEIFRDRKILKRESFLNLSRSGYLFGKTGILFGFAAVQMASYVVVSALVLGIPALYPQYWLMMFSLSCFAIMLGLNVSATFNSAVTIYIIIPLLLIPQLILSGTVVRFDKLNPGFSSPKVVPFAADLMASRWAYEGLMVINFKENPFQKRYFDLDREMSDAVYVKDYWVPKMEAFSTFCNLHMDEKEDSLKQVFEDRKHIIATEVKMQSEESPEIALDCANEISNGNFSDESTKCLREWLAEIRKHYVTRWNVARKEKDRVYNEFLSEFKDEAAYLEYRDRTHNESIDKLVRNSDSGTRLLEVGGEVIRTFEPVYYTHEPHSFPGYRTHFYAPYKSFFGLQINTFFFNVFVIWLMSFLLFVTLYFEVFNKFINRFSKSN